MNDIRKLLKARKILKRYTDKPQAILLGAEHDIIYIHPPYSSRPLSKEDVEKMIKLGLHQENAVVDGEFTAENYDEGESWCIYT